MVLLKMPPYHRPIRMKTSFELEEEELSLDQTHDLSDER